MEGLVRHSHDLVQTAAICLILSLCTSDYRNAGGEYIKHLVLRNVSESVIKVKYKLPSSKFFYMEFPQVITLSPGVSYSVPVSFRPVVQVDSAYICQVIACSHVRTTVCSRMLR